jgi:predicted nucleic acid-binding protein
MDRIFVDTDVLLDLLEQREPFYKSSAYLFSKAEKREIQILISSLSFTNIILYQYPLHFKKKV